MLSNFKRPILELVATRLGEPRRHIQILFGPRQVGKTTLIQQAIKQIDTPVIFASADAESGTDGLWISQQWDRARLALSQKGKSAVLLVLDEVQKINNWSEFVKREWDEDTAQNLPVKVVLLGSSSLMIQQGMTESLAGRFELIRIPHWSFGEMKQAFGATLDEYIFFGGYPGAAALRVDIDRWKRYVRDALVEPAITRDVLLMTRVDKPALLRQLFHWGSSHSGQIISYNKLLGQLHDAGNTTTLAHYLHLLNTAGLLGGLQKYAGTEIRRRSSSPKLHVYNNALMSSLAPDTFATARGTPEIWGHYVESAVGAHLMNGAFETDRQLYYWRDGDYEVDFVLARQDRIVAIEVKSGKPRSGPSGMNKFVERFKPYRALVVGSQGIPLGEFLAMSIDQLSE